MELQRHYASPLITRYASSTISELFSPHNIARTYREIWIALAEAEKEMGLAISEAQIKEMKAQAHQIDLPAIAQYEKKFKHDVMAHIHAFGDLCPQARPIIHLGATSCTVTDNADILIMRSALQHIKQMLLSLLKALSEKAMLYKDVPCVGFTHGQTAQPTTIGKRIACWLQDFMLDFEHLEHLEHNLQLLGLKGATGTQASFLELFHGDHVTVQKLERAFAKNIGFEKIISLSGQTYTRKQDVYVLNCLADIAISAHKMATDIRLLATLKECTEPFEQHQIGSSAMPFKRNPMKSERVCSLARYLISLSENPKYTASTQWLERSLDDSANRRLCIPEAFLATDGILRLLVTVTEGIVINHAKIQEHLAQELPFLTIETILMRCVQKGADRQIMHERLRTHAMASYAETSDGTTLFNRIAQDGDIPISLEELQAMDVMQFIGCAPQQVGQFITWHVQPVLEKHKQTITTIEAPKV